MPSIRGRILARRRHEDSASRLRPEPNTSADRIVLKAASGGFVNRGEEGL